MTANNNALSETHRSFRHPELIRRIAWAGYLAKALVYGTVGLLALMTALGFASGRVTGPRGALETLGSQPFGQMLLAATAIGLLAFTLWRFTQAVGDPDGQGSDAGGLLARAGLAVSGLIYASLAVYAARTALASPAAGAGSTTEERTATLMSQPFGIWLVGAVGAVLIGLAIYQFYRAWKRSFERRWSTASMGASQHEWAVRLSRIGLGARGLAFVLIGWFLVQAALEANPSEAAGLGGALSEFAHQPAGRIWLAAISFGFVCYGVYCAVNAKYRHVNIG